MKHNPEDFDRLAEIHKDRFRKAFQEALQDVSTLYVQTSHHYTLADKAYIMHIHVRDRMTKNFTGVPGAEPFFKPGRAFKIKLDGAPYGIPIKAELKCKKLTAQLLTSNIRTRAVNNFEKGRPETYVQSSFGDWRDPQTVSEAEPTHGNAGYIINSLWTAFERLCVTCYTGARSARLAVEIPLGGNASTSTVINLPVGEITEVKPRKRVKPRRKNAAGEAADGKEARTPKRIKFEVVVKGEEQEKKRNKGE